MAPVVGSLDELGQLAVLSDLNHLFHVIRCYLREVDGVFTRFGLTVSFSAEAFFFPTGITLSLGLAILVGFGVEGLTFG